MARRRIVEQPTSRLAQWARRCAVFALAVVVLAILIVRADLVETLPGMATFAAGLAVAAVAVLLALAAFAVIWQEGLAGFGQAFLGFVIGAALLAFPAYLVITRYDLPPISDITTDTVDPPPFQALARERPRDANPIAYPGAEAAQLQRTVYPDIEPADLSVSPQDAYNAALAVVRARRWRIVDARPPAAGSRDALLEAVARTPILGLRDDVALRIRAIAGGARLDIRSASRYGRRDFGTNAQRVRSLLEDIERAATGQARP